MRPEPAPLPCDWCGENASIVKRDGAWCTDEHERFDRGSETTWRRNAEARWSK